MPQRRQHETNGGGSLTIVWVVLGDWERQAYVTESIRQAYYWNPGVQLVVVAPPEHHEHIWEVLPDLQITCVSTVELESDVDMKTFYSRFFISREMGSAEFNRLTSARLYYLKAWMQLTHTTNCVHLENDNMLYFDVGAWATSMQKCQIAVATTCREMKPARHFMIAGLVYVRDWQSLTTILRGVNNLLARGKDEVVSIIGNEWVNDMSLLAQYYWDNMEQGHPPQSYIPPRMLTILPEGLGGLGTGDPSGHYDEKRQCIWEKTHMVYDNAAIAIWFYGDHFERKPKQNALAWGAYERIPANRNNSQLLWKLDARNLLYPVWNGIRVASLHMHSKELAAVSSIRSEHGKMTSPRFVAVESGVKLTGDVRIQGTYGRSGNMMNIVINLLKYALQNNCNVTLPETIISGWTAPIHKFQNTVTSSSPKGLCSYQDASSMFNRTELVLHAERLSNHVKSVLRTYLAVNLTHALGKRCPTQRFAVMHIRAGDTTDGAYDLRTGLFVQGGPVNPNYPPYPTAFYVRALKEVKDFSVIILCETLSNPSCDFFAKLESLVDNVRVRVGGDVVEDVHLLLCASEVVTSIGSFKNLLVTSVRLQGKHDFDSRASCVHQTGTTYYYIDNPHLRDVYNVNVVTNWSNTPLQRSLVDRIYAIQTCN